MAELDSAYPGTQAASIPEAQSRIDFRIRRLEGSNWEIAVLSTNGRGLAMKDPHIARADRTGSMYRTDLDGVNGFVREARLKGYRAEYVGPNGVIRF